jgi:hypothetical protein
MPQGIENNHLHMNDPVKNTHISARKRRVPAAAADSLVLFNKHFQTLLAPMCRKREHCIPQRIHKKTTVLRLGLQIYITITVTLLLFRLLPPFARIPIISTVRRKFSGRTVFRSLSSAPAAGRRRSQCGGVPTRWARRARGGRLLRSLYRSGRLRARPLSAAPAAFTPPAARGGARRNGGRAAAARAGSSQPRPHHRRAHAAARGGARRGGGRRLRRRHARPPAPHPMWCSCAADAVDAVWRRVGCGVAARWMRCGGALDAVWRRVGCAADAGQRRLSGVARLLRGGSAADALGSRSKSCGGEESPT